MYMRALNIILALVWGVVFMGITPRPLAASPTTGPAAATNPDQAVVIPLTGEINDSSRDSLLRRFKHAQAIGAKVVILELDTPGGLVTSALDISRFLRGQTDIHTIAFVKNEAYSGGALVALACNEIVMSPTSVLGDCAPILLSSDHQLQPMPPTERAKAESPVLADFLESTRKNGYDPLLAEAMVRVDSPLHLLQNDQGAKRVVSDKDYAKMLADGWKPVPGVADPVNAPGTLLTVGPELAVQLGLAKGVSPSSNTLASERGFNLVADLTPGPGEMLVELLASAPARFLFILIFLQSLYIVLHAPGHGAAEAVAVVAFTVLVGVPLLTGYAQWWEILVVLVGLALCAFEVLVFPGHGVSLAVGALMVIFGLVMTFAGPVPGQPSFLPATSAGWHGVQRGLIAVSSALVCSVILSVWMRKYLPKIPYFNRLILTATSGTALRQTPSAQKVESALDMWPFVGTVGIATSGLRPGGSARFPYGDDSRVASVQSASGYIAPGGKLVVQEIQGNRIVVRATT